MGQIVSASAKPKRCNLNKLSQLGTPVAGEYILVSSDNSMNSDGQGNFDCCIVGDGSTPATALEVKPIANGAIQFGNKNAVSGQTLVEELRETKTANKIATFVKGSYFDASCVLRSNSSLYYVDHLDLTGYISITVSARVISSAYCFILDANDNVLYRWQNGTSPYIKTIDLTQYPTAKYACLSDYGASNRYVNGTYIDPSTTKEKIADINQSINALGSSIDSGIMAKSAYCGAPLTKESGYINSSGAFVSGSYACAREVDISEFSRICCWGYSYGTVYSALYDENMSLIRTFQSGAKRYFVVDLSLYPEAKYVSISSVNSGISLCGYKKNKVSDILFNVAVDAFFNQQKIVTQRLEGFYSGYRTFTSSSTNRGYKSNLIAVKEGYHITLSSSGNSNTLNYISYDENLNVVSIVSGQTINNSEIVVPEGVAFYEFFSFPTALVVSVAEFESDSEESESGNILYKKSYVAIGDSFTDSIGTGKIEGGIYDGMSKVYPYIIGNRNRMSVLNQGASGSVLNGYILNSRYNAIPEDVDYITIWYGINDTGHHISVGTVDDEPETITSETSTTTCGGFNWFFRWILTNRPLAKVGVIVTDFCEQTRREAIIACCQKWGIAYLDLYDPTIPMIRTRGNTRYTHDTAIAPLGYVEVCNDAKTLRNAVFASDGESNIHPSNTCHEWQSTFIEAFMRSL